MGRPKAENPLDVDVKVRLDKETTDRLDAHCAATGKARATVIRAAIRKYLNI
ncbi:MAG: CopG family transcriptional regulator [Clostridia bacterium]|nr:CopG family transcriptional regulator [Clostridia bacterium]